MCSQPCQEECPDGWACTQVSGAGPDLVFVCVSNYPNLCRPCAEADDCAGNAGTEDACVHYGDQGSFCGGICSIDPDPKDGPAKDCPWGFSCEEVTTVDGIVTTQCVADAGVCPCTETSVSLGLWTPCKSASEFGVCTGKRACTDDGLTDCDAAVPAAETCNGMDDDCDGEADEPDLLEGEYLVLCDDDNDCTDDKCAGEGGCVNEPLDGGGCDDGHPCTVADHCDQGTCIGDPVECDDDNPCTDNVCTEMGGCEYPAISGPCDDGNPCTLGDQCGDGECHGTAVPCDCQADSDCAALEDGDLCNGSLICDTSAVPYQCQVDPETFVVCPEPEGIDAFCLQPQCEPATGACSLVPAHDALLCDNGDACTVNDKCTDGVCAAGNAVNCNDGNPCTDDSCTPDSGCTHTDNQAPCNDNDVCSTQDQCDQGQCLGGQSLVCDDGDKCNGLETCDGNTGCVGGQSLVCNDGDLCNGLETCDPETGCVGGQSLACDDGDKCNGLETCDPETGCMGGQSLVCDDGDKCNGLETCSPETGCVGGQSLECSDDNVCTDDSCDPDSGCVYAPLTGPECDDGSECTELDLCDGGECVGTGSKNCDDANVCTDNSCDPELGCVTTLNQALCDDGNLCTTGDHCHLGECITSGVLPCEDNNQCTGDSCDSVAGCQFVPNDADCDDQNQCTDGDQCGGGWCIGGPPLDCADQNPCTDDSCVPGEGCSYTANADPCDDLNECTVDDQCSNKECGPGPAMDCDDDKECTTDTCAPDSGCVNEPVAENTECNGGIPWACEQGECVCQPQCDGKQCGDDGCEGECGQCDPLAQCADGQCVPLCEPLFYGTAGQGVNNGWTCDDVCGDKNGTSIDWLDQQEQVDFCLQVRPGSEIIVASPSNYSYPIFDTQNGKDMCKVNANGQKSQGFPGGGTPVYGDQILCKCEKSCECVPECGANEMCVTGQCVQVICPNGFEPVLGGTDGRSWWKNSGCTGTEYIEPPPFGPPWRPVPTPLCKATSGTNFSVKSVKTTAQCKSTSASASTIWLEVANPL